MPSRILIYTGKGGTGKSVISCATGLRCSELGYKTMVLSADPAHSLSDAFSTNVGSEPVEVSKNLWAMQIDSIAEVKKSYAAIQEYFAKVLSAKGIDEVLAYELASLPAMTNTFALLKLEELEGSDYDVVILDTVPSGEALRYIFLPKIVGRVGRKLLGMLSPLAGAMKLLEPIFGAPTPDKEAIRGQVSLVGRLERLWGILSDVDRSSVRLIANPDTFSFENLMRTLLITNLYGVNVDLAIINKVLPSVVKDGYFKEWISSQEEIERKLERNVYPLPVKRLRLFERELKGMDMLKKCADELFGEEDPASIYYKGSPFEISSSKDRLVIRIRAPFTSKEDLDVERFGDELIVRMKTEMGEVVNVIPLPAMAYLMSLKRAKLSGGRLNVEFERER
ncbi:MAG: TRC40/GET3/ArsA family transport-energizing ATPase [Thaumarchaeota archaeon]|nr:TRC40/GET3/ArsA family transport-energizing ATPase [Nitrososphaerota archaeon]